MAETDQETEQFGAAVDQFLTRSYDGSRRLAILSRSSGWDGEFNGELAELGCFALAVPEAHGGLGLPLSALGPVFEQFGRHLVVGPTLENALIPSVLIGMGDPPLRTELEAVVESGTPVALIDPGVTEDWRTEIGSVALSGRTLTGHVNAVRFATQSNFLVVIADDAICLIRSDACGVQIENQRSSDPASSFAHVSFENAEAELVTHDGPGIELVTRLRSWARILIACELSGLAQRSIELTVDYLKQREQFDRPIGSFQALKHIAADMHSRGAGLHNLCRATLSDTEQAGPRELELLASTLKAHAAATAPAICQDAIQLHGGMGFTTESDVSWLYRRALALEGWYGDSTELARQIGATLLHTTTAQPETDSRLVATQRRVR